MPPILLERPTCLLRLDAGPVECRLERRGSATVVIFHGGHMRAGLALGEDVFLAAGYTVLVPSRPGYGRTPLSTGTTPTGFADVTRALCDHLGITQVAAVVGISAGGPTAVTMAARHPDLVRRLILQSAVGWSRWPARGARLVAPLLFGPTERLTWWLWRGLLHTAPDLALRLMLGQLSTLPPTHTTAKLSPEHRAGLLAVLTGLRSGRGFRNDLRPTRDVTAKVVQPTLVVASRTDGAVPYAHARTLAAALHHAALVDSRADGHLIWYSPDWPTVAARIRDFLAADPRDAPDPDGPGDAG